MSVSIEEGAGLGLVFRGKRAADSLFPGRIQNRLLRLCQLQPRESHASPISNSPPPPFKEKQRFASRMTSSLPNDFCSCLLTKLHVRLCTDSKSFLILLNCVRKTIYIYIYKLNIFRHFPSSQVNRGNVIYIYIYNALKNFT